MALNKIFCLAFMFCFVHKVASEIFTDGEITVDPPNLAINYDQALNGGSVTVQCKILNKRDDETILKTFISRTVVIEGSVVKQRLLQTFVNNNLEILDVPDLEGVSASGSIDQEYINLTMAQTKCKDVGNYICEMEVIKTGEVSKDVEKTASLDVEVMPGQIFLGADPAFDTYNVNTSMSMLCNGPVGSVVDNLPVVKWIWQSVDFDDFPLPREVAEEGDWEDVQNSTNIYYIDEGQPIPETAKCSETRKSRLFITLTLQDSNRAFRCFPQRGTRRYPQFAGNYTIKSVIDPLQTTTPGSEDDDSGDSPPSKASVAPIIGGVIGILVLIIIIIVVIVCVVRRKNANKEENYAGDNPGNKPADELTGPPYAISGVTYSQPPNRFARNDREPYGVHNKGMEPSPKTEPYHPPRTYGNEPSPPRSNSHRDDYDDDKNDNSYHPQPPRYANDFHQGRRNRGYSYDPDPTAGSGGRSRYSSDDDGTADSAKINTSQQSIGRGDPTIGTAI